jgi:hypothetical protein
LFDAVWKQIKGFKESYRQFYGNLDAINNDREIFEMLVTQHGFERDEMRELMEPRMKQCSDLIV